MKIKVSKILIDYEKKPLQFRPNQDDPLKDARMKDVIMPCILSPGRGGSWQDHMKRDEIAHKIFKAEEFVDLDSEEIQIIKNSLSGSSFSPIAVAQVCRILEGKDE